MSEIIMSETEKQQFTEFKRKLGLQAAQAQVNKIEYNLCDAAVEKGTLRRACQDANMRSARARQTLRGVFGQ